MQFRHRAIVGGEQYLKQRRMRGAAWRIDRLHHFFEGHILMSDSFPHHTLNALQQFRSRRIASQRDTQRHVVQHHADDIFHFLGPTVGHTRPDADVIRPRISRQ